MSDLLENMKAPYFTSDRDGGSLIDTSLLSSPYIIYFYPKDDTPGCTKEAIEFSKESNFFLKNNISVIGISKDNVAKHDKFILKHNLNIILASDLSGVVCDLFGVWVEKSMYGRKYMGIERSTFLISAENIIYKVWRKVKVNNHVNEVIEHSKAMLNI